MKKWVAFGASVRAAQYLVLGAKARALTSGRYHVSFEDIRAPGAPGAASPRADELPRAVGGHHQRHAGRPPARSRRRSPRSGMSKTDHDLDLLDPRRTVRRSRRSSRASGTSSWWRARSWTASSTACTGPTCSGRRWTSPSTAATSPATTSAAWTGGCSRGPIATTSRSTRPTRTPTSRSCSTCSKSMGFGSSRASRSSITRRCSPAA